MPSARAFNVSGRDSLRAQGMDLREAADACVRDFFVGWFGLLEVGLGDGVRSRDELVRVDRTNGSVELGNR